MNDTAKKFVDVIKEIFRDGYTKKDKTLTCIVEQVNTDGTLDVYIPPDSSTILQSVVNESKYAFRRGDAAVLYVIGGNVSNAFVVAKFHARDADGYSVGEGESAASRLGVVTNNDGNVGSVLSLSAAGSPTVVASTLSGVVVDASPLSATATNEPFQWEITTTAWSGEEAPFAVSIEQETHGKGLFPFCKIFDDNNEEVFAKTEIDHSEGTIVVYSNVKIPLRIYIYRE